MRASITTIVLIALAWGCDNKQQPKNKPHAESKSNEKTEPIFKQIADYPIIKDSAEFMAELKKEFKLEIEESPLQKENEKISAYEKVKIYGSENDYYIIEYDYGDGCSAAFPWKYQILLTSEGELVKVLSGIRFDFVSVFSNQHPALVTVMATAKGNGGHALYKISADTLENIYDCCDFDNALRTYDAHQDNTVNQPKELNISVGDYNQDGINDISFNGKIVLIRGRNEKGDWHDGEVINGKEVRYSIEKPFEKIPVELIFLYDEESGHFKTKEDYAKKYNLTD